MADPRVAATDRYGTGHEPKTYKCDSSIVFDATVTPGHHAGAGWAAVTITGDGIVGLAGANECILGRLNHVEFDGYAAIDEGHVVSMRKGDGTLTNGQAICGDVRTAAKGYVKTPLTDTIAHNAVGRHLCLSQANGADDVEIRLD